MNGVQPEDEVQECLTPLHAKRSAASHGTQGLFRHGDRWTIAELELRSCLNACRTQLSMRCEGYCEAIRPASTSSCLT